MQIGFIKSVNQQNTAICDKNCWTLYIIRTIAVCYLVWPSQSNERVKYSLFPTNPRMCSVFASFTETTYIPLPSAWTPGCLLELAHHGNPDKPVHKFSQGSGHRDTQCWFKSDALVAFLCFASSVSSQKHKNVTKTSNLNWCSVIQATTTLVDFLRSAWKVLCYVCRLVCFQ